LSVGRAVESLTIDAHARRDDEPIDGPFDDRLEERRGADVVHRRVVFDFVHALTDANRRGEVIHNIDAAERAVEIVRIAHVTDDKLDVVGEIRGPRRACAVHLSIEIVERADAIATSQQFVSQMRRDEAGTSGDQDLSRHLSPSPPSTTAAGRPIACRRNEKQSSGTASRRAAGVAAWCKLCSAALGIARQIIWTANAFACTLTVHIFSTAKAGEAGVTR